MENILRRESAALLAEKSYVYRGVVGSLLHGGYHVVWLDILF